MLLFALYGTMNAAIFGLGSPLRQGEECIDSFLCSNGPVHAQQAQPLGGLVQAHLGERLRAVRVPNSQPSRRRKRVVHFYDISFESPPKR